MTNTLLTYDDVAVLFRAANLPCSTRTVRRHIWENPTICPMQPGSYHFKRVRSGHVAKLIKHLVNTGHARQKSIDTIAREAK